MKKFPLRIFLSTHVLGNGSNVNDGEYLISHANISIRLNFKEFAAIRWRTNKKKTLIISKCWL